MMPASAQRSRSWKPLALQVYRFAILAFIVALVHDHHVRLRINGDIPITIDEIKSFYPKAQSLSPDYSERKGLHVLDAEGKEIGYVVRTSPLSDSITGYVGPTDTLVAMDSQLKVLGIKIRRSDDTRVHVSDVGADRHFPKTWNGMNWDEVANMDLQKAGVEGVSGATKTSMAVAEGIVNRFKQTNAAMAYKPRLQFHANDIGLIVVVLLAGVMAFTHFSGRKWLRRAFQIGVIVYVGFINGDLLAQSLLHGWMKSGIAWHAGPGIALLGVAAFIIPWTTKRPLYCLHICPHGAAQELAGRILPAKYRLKLPNSLADWLRWIPPALLIVALVTTMLLLPIDLATIEPFDAYIIKSAGAATIIIAVVGMIASLFVPQAYCKFGCPTGAVLEFVRSHGANDRFGRRDIVAGLMVLIVAVLYWKYAAVSLWINGPA